MRKAVIDLVKLGPLPDSASIDPEQLERYHRLFVEIAKPLTDEEACALVKLLGPDECFGAAWTLLHLIETAPGWPIMSCLENAKNVWVSQLRERAEMANKEN